MNDTVICISQARMTSSRLPAKILKEVCGRSLLDYHVSRLLKSRLINKLIIATTVNSTDDAIEDFCDTRKIYCIRGSEDDVLSRYFKALENYEADIVVRVTSDCPLIDPILVDQVIEYYKDHQSEYDYVSLGSENFPRGLDVEVFSTKALKTAYRLGTKTYEREHVTPYIYGPDSEFKCGIFPSQETSGDHRWCVDEPRDFELISKILEAFEGGDDFSWKDCLVLFEANPEWFAINRTVKQKKLGE